MATIDHAEPYACARAWVALREVHALVNDALENALAEECGLTINEFETLLHLQTAAPGRVRLGDLGAAVPLSQPALSRLADRLERQGLVRRGTAEDDRRSVLLELTDTGLERLNRAVPVHARCIQSSLTGRLTDAEQETLVTLLGRLSGH